MSNKIFCYVLILLGSLILTSIHCQLIIANRGASADFPENTDLAYQSAIKFGSDAILANLRLSKDGVVVLIYDADVNRTTTSSGLVANMTYEELSQLNAAYTKKFGTTYFAAGLKIIRLREFAENYLIENATFLFPNNTNVSLVMDLRVENMSSYIRNEIGSLNIYNKLIAACWTNGQLNDITHNLPEIRVIQKMSDNVESIDYYWNKSVNSLSINATKIDQGYIKTVHRHFLTIFGFTINKREDVERMLDSDIDGIITDHPFNVIAWKTEWYQLNTLNIITAITSNDYNALGLGIGIGIVIGITITIIFLCMCAICCRFCRRSSVDALNAEADNYFWTKN